MRAIRVDLVLLQGFRLSEIYDKNPDLLVINLSNIKQLETDQLILLKRLKDGLPITIDRKYRKSEQVTFKCDVVFKRGRKIYEKLIDDLVIAETQLVIRPNDETLLNAEKCRAKLKEHLNTLL